LATATNKKERVLTNSSAMPNSGAYFNNSPTKIRPVRRPKTWSCKNDEDIATKRMQTEEYSWVPPNLPLDQVNLQVSGCINKNNVGTITPLPVIRV